MKKTLTTTFITLTMGISLAAQASMELEDACNSDPDLIDTVVEIIRSGTNVNGYFTGQELVQVNAVLSDGANQSGTVSEKVKAVLSACADGRILQDRYSNIIKAG